MENNIILKMMHIRKEFPGVIALDDVHFELLEGEVHVLLGENGAGKSTLIKILSGAYQKTDGQIYLYDREAGIRNPRHAQEMGISVIYQELNLIHRISIAENIYLGRAPRKNGIIQWKQMYQDAKTLLNSFDVDMDVSKIVRELSLAQQQIVEIFKAVSINAKVVIMDEPTSSLTDNETKVLFRIINNLKNLKMGNSW